MTVRAWLGLVRRRDRSVKTGSIPPSPPEPTQVDACRQWRQADTFHIEELAIVGRDGHPAVVGTPSGVALISQSCDVVIPTRPYVQVAPIVELSGDVAAAARDGKRSQYAHLPALGNDLFADLDVVSTLLKEALVGCWLAHGVVGDTATRRFSGSVARRFGRFAFPDDVSDAMKALRDLVQSKSGNAVSPFGALLEDVVELRAECSNWSLEPCNTTIVIIVKPGALPMLLDDELDELPSSVAGFRADSANAKSKLSEISSALTDGSKVRTPIERHWLWIMLGESAALLCQTRARKLYDSRADTDKIAQENRDYATVPQFSSDVVSADEFPLSRVRLSEIVDLDHLSVPAPLPP